jgi:hypothetical protein
MPKVKISEYSATANSNTDVASINIDEGCAPSGINNAIRAVMGHLKDFQQGTNGDPFNGPVNGTLGATTASTANVTTLTTSSTVTHNGGTINGVAYLNGSKVLTTGSALTFDGTNLGLGGTTNSYGSQTTMTLSGTNVSRIDFRSNSVFTGTILSYQAITEGLRLQTEAGYPITFSPAGTEAMRLTSTSLYTASTINVGIGTSSPAEKLHVVGKIAVSGTNPSIRQTVQNASLDLCGGTTVGTDPAIQIIGSTTTSDANKIFYNANAHVFRTSSGGSTYATIDTSGNLLVGNTSASGGKVDILQSANFIGMTVRCSDASYTTHPLDLAVDRNTTNNSYYFIRAAITGVQYRFQVADSGNVTNINNSYGGISDIKLKENIVDATPKLAGLMQVKVRNYNLIGDAAKQLGVVAQELETVFPSMIDEAPDRDAEGNDLGTTTKSVKYSVFVPMLIKAMQEQQSIIQSLTARITALEGA